jgi:hypothetical protein
MKVTLGMKRIINSIFTDLVLVIAVVFELAVLCFVVWGINDAEVSYLFILLLICSWMLTLFAFKTCWLTFDGQQLVIITFLTRQCLNVKDIKTTIFAEKPPLYCRIFGVHTSKIDVGKFSTKDKYIYYVFDIGPGKQGLFIETKKGIKYYINIGDNKKLYDLLRANVK